MRKVFKVTGIVLFELIVLAISVTNSFYDTYSIINILDYIWDMDEMEFGLSFGFWVLIPVYEVIIHKTLNLMIKCVKEFYNK